VRLYQAYSLFASLWLASSGNAYSQDLRRHVSALEVAGGPLKGGLRLQKDDGRINWYFSNLGLFPLCKTDPTTVRVHLELYLCNLDPDTGTIKDVKDIASGARQAPDSDDSYTATLLTLAARYQTTCRDPRWWALHRSALKSTCRKNLLEQQKPSGLVTAFAGDKSRQTAYLMDNCEVYRGLADFAGLLASENDPDFKAIADAAERVARGVASLFDEQAGAFRVADIPAGTSFYPLRAAQVFPEVFGVPLGDEKQTHRLYDAAWHSMISTGDRWERGQVKDGSLGGYPWMILGYAAAKRGEFDLAKTQLRFFKKALKSACPPPAFTAVHELGWAIRTKELLRAKDRQKD
jgi:hypothetical protein